MVQFELLQAVSPEPLARAEVDRDLVLLWAALGWQAPPMEGAIPLVTSLREAGVKVAVASNAQTWWVEHHLRRLGLTVDAVAIGDEPGMQPKPAPDLYLAAVARLGTSPDRTVAIDDLPDGAAAAQAAGLIAIHLCANGISTEHPPNQVRSLTELDIARLTELVADSL